jgi:hypothetical protein
MEALKYCLLWTGPDEWAPRRGQRIQLLQQIKGKDGTTA